MTEAQKQRILRKIEKIKKELRYEKKAIGGYHDGGGRRYSIMELYLQLKDHRKTSRYMSWFYKHFPDDVTYVRFKIGAARTKFELKKYKEAKKHIISVFSDNTYILDLLLDRVVTQIDKREFFQHEKLDWAKEDVKNLGDLLHPEFKNWLDKFISEEEFVERVEGYIEIQKLLKGVNEVEERGRLLDMGRKYIKDWQDSV